MHKEIRLGTRPSALAIKQAEEIQRLLPFIRFKIVLIETEGDRDKITPFSVIERSNFFTRELEEALMQNKIDVAVHSAKDLEENIPPSLKIAAITASVSPYECLVSRENKRLDNLEKGARVGTSSTKRKEALLKYRSDLKLLDIRGTIEERLCQLDEGKFDALVMAHAALIRLGLEERIAQIIPVEIIEPHPLQGALAIQVRSKDTNLISLFSELNAYMEV